MVSHILVKSRQRAERVHTQIVARIERGYDPREVLERIYAKDLSRLRTFHHVWPRHGDYNRKEYMIYQLLRQVYSKYVTPKSEKEALQLAAQSGDPVAKMALHDYEEEHP